MRLLENCTETNTPDSFQELVKRGLRVEGDLLGLGSTGIYQKTM